jgi:hypothetical protein
MLSANKLGHISNVPGPCALTVRDTCHITELFSQIRVAFLSSSDFTDQAL